MFPKIKIAKKKDNVSTGAIKIKKATKLKRNSALKKQRLRQKKK